VTKSQVIIKKPAVSRKGHVRAHFSEEVEQNVASTSRQGEPGNNSPEFEDLTLDEPQDELTRIRAMLRPPPVPGLEDWGIPAECTDAPDPALVTKLNQFHSLKKDPQNPRHFNDTLMSNRSFRNPHLYARMVDFIDVDERTTNFPKEIWDPDGVQEDWFADSIAEVQKVRYEQEGRTQSSGKRTQIDFTSSSTSKNRNNDRSSGPNSGAPLGKKSRFQPYGSEAVGGGPHNRGPYSTSGSSNTRSGHARWG